jgi:co-chaperonin GroES (HSP10)|tara:strand:- start:109 stop:369 length:261 start_codon:yes stop_codon:yes gene_type:complete
MKAVGKYIVIKPIKEANAKTKGGLILSENQREDIRYRQAEVLVVGEDVKALKKKDNIYYDKAAGFNIEVKGKVLKVIKEFDVVVVL